MVRTRDAFLFVAVLGLLTAAASGYVALPNEDAVVVEESKVLFSSTLNEFHAVVIESDTREQIRASMAAKLMEAFGSRPQQEEISEPLAPVASDATHAEVPLQYFIVEEPLPAPSEEEIAVTKSASSTTASSSAEYSLTESPVSASSTEETASSTSSANISHATST